MASTSAKLSEIDEVLIQYADTLSAEAISFKIEGALTPAQVRQRIADILATPDWLTAVQQDQLVTQKMRLLVSKLEELPLTARTAEVMLAGLRAVGERLDKRQAANEADLNRHYAFEGVMLLENLESALGAILEYLGDNLSPAEHDTAIELGLRHAQLEQAKYEGTATAEPVEQGSPEPVRLGG
jgi:hypothetical protein